MHIKDNPKDTYNKRWRLNTRGHRIDWREFRLRYESKEAGMIIQEVLKDDYNKYVMPKKLLLRSITSTYNELVNTSELTLDLTSYLFKEILNEAGLFNIAKRKFTQIIAGCLKHSENFRIKLFGKFLGLYEESYNLEDFILYIKILKEVSLSYSSFNT